MDDQIRLIDALTAIPKIQLFSNNQMAAARGAGWSGPVAPLSDVDFACRRLFDALADDMWALPGTAERPRTKVWDVAFADGIPMKINGGTVWYNFRQMFFTRKRKRGADLLRYGNLLILSAHGAADGWKKLLGHLVNKEAGKIENGKVRIRVPTSCRDWLDSLKLAPATAEKLAIKYAKMDQLT